MKTTLSLITLLFSISSSAVTLDSQPYNNPAEMTYAQSQAFCTSRNARLPTIREVTEDAVRSGYGSIRETAFPNQPIGYALQAEINKETAEGYYVVSKLNSAGVVNIDFYFKLINQVPSPWYRNSYYTSSVSPFNAPLLPGGGTPYYTVIGQLFSDGSGDASTGIVVRQDWWGEQSVRCAH